MRRIQDGIIILTCLAVSWEWVHWLSAIININHSEGPHRFLKSSQLSQSFKNANLSNANLEFAKLTGANFVGANLTNTNFTNAELGANNFSNAIGLDKTIGLKM